MKNINKEYFIKLDDKELKDFDDKIIYFTYEDAKRYYEALAKAGCDVTYGKDIKILNDIFL
jgi:hypothetical protein